MDETVLIFCYIASRESTFIDVSVLTAKSSAASIAFQARRLSVERNSYGNVAGWLAGCLSHSGIVSKRLNLSENFFDHLKAPSF